MGKGARNRASRKQETKSEPAYHIHEAKVVYDDDKAVGRRCVDCGAVFTMAGNPSLDATTDHRGIMKANKAHEKRSG